MSSFLLRNAQLRDRDDVYALTRHLDTVNLPKSKLGIEQIIEKSLQSFDGQIEPFDREYLFVLENIPTEKVLGTSLIIAQHGLPDSPHIFFEIYNDDRYSETLHRKFCHQVLRIGYSYSGPTEIGGLVLDPQLRNHPEHLGRQLSYIRFVFMAKHPKLFKPMVLAELMPPLPNGRSLLWEAVGKKFTGLDYREADHLSRKDKKFVQTLFPEAPIYVSLLNKEVQQSIGQVGKETTGAKIILEKTGFRYVNRIDPFDGGPHFEAPLDEIRAIKETRNVCVCLKADVPSRSKGMLAVFHNSFSKDSSFLAAVIPYVCLSGNEIGISKDIFQQFGLANGDAATILDFANEGAKIS